jgi:hypothetical protein
VLPTGTFFTGEVSFDFTGVAQVDDALPPHSSSALDAAVLASLSLAVSELLDGRRFVHLIVDPDLGSHPELRGVGLSLEVEVLRDEVVQERRHLFVSAYESPVRRSSLHSNLPQPFDSATLDSLPTVIEGDALERAHWSLRVRGASRGVWGLWYAQSYWNGAGEVALDALLRREHEVAGDRRRLDFALPPDHGMLPRIEAQPRGKR